jgi:hypothetical protein
MIIPFEICFSFPSRVINVKQLTHRHCRVKLKKKKNKFKSSVPVQQTPHSTF